MSESRDHCSLCHQRACAAKFLCALAALMALVGCSSTPPADSAGGPRKVTLLAAASTTESVQEIARAFEKKTGDKVTVSTGPSSGLAQQIIAGAPADVFLSANERWARAIEDRGLAQTVKKLLANKLVMVAPKDNPAGVSSPADLTSDKVKRVALAGEQVPAGIYADQALRSLKLLDPLIEKGKIVRGHDVRATLGYVEQGEVEAGIVYATDAMISQRVEVVYTFADDTHDPIVYPAVLLKRESTASDKAGEAGAAARELFEFLASPEAAKVFRRHGFAPLDSPRQAPPSATAPQSGGS